MARISGSELGLARISNSARRLTSKNCFWLCKWIGEDFWQWRIVNSAPVQTEHLICNIWPAVCVIQSKQIYPAVRACAVANFCCPLMRSSKILLSAHAQWIQGLTERGREKKRVFFEFPRNPKSVQLSWIFFCRQFLLECFNCSYCTLGARTNIKKTGHIFKYKFQFQCPIRFFECFFDTLK